MPVSELPHTLTLPSGTRMTLGQPRGHRHSEGPREPDPNAPRFADVLELLQHDVTLADAKGAPIDVDDLALSDFHVLRAVLTKAGLVHEGEVELDCHNCGELFVTKPCATLELGPWIDGELDDPELDRTLPLGSPIDIAPIQLGRVRQAHTVTFSPRNVAEVKPLWAALSKDPIDVNEAFVVAMGIRALGPVSEPKTIARALAECSEAAFASVTDAFIDAHYSLRLASDVLCAKCKAKNTTIAPALREFELSLGDSDEESESIEEAARAPWGGADEYPPLPPLEEFVELAHAIAEPLIAEIPGEKAILVVEDGTPAVDDGGVPLLGSYAPPPPKDLPIPTQPPTVTIYYRTFEAMEREEGPYDWRGELAETIEHELEHHLFFLRGHDPMDEEEHAEIDREAVRVVGRGESKRRAIASFGQSWADFFRRGWPLVLIGALVLALTIAEGRCSP